MTNPDTHERTADAFAETDPDTGNVCIRPPGPGRALRWLAALGAADVPYRLQEEEDGWVIHVRHPQAERALWEVQEYERVNRNWPPPAPAPVDEATVYDSGGISLLAALLLVIVFGLTGPFTRQVPACDRGCADSARIVAGEWWRAITALTLHVDVSHLAGNALCFVFFGRALRRQIGPGLAWSLILAAGALGNAAAAVCGDPGHTAVGASTAAFGALGILAALQFVSKWRRYGNLRSVWAPSWVAAGAGVALLALLGTGPRADLLGHLFGFVAGAALGTLPAACPTRHPSKAMQRCLLGLLAAVVLGAWCLALQ